MNWPFKNVLLFPTVLEGSIRFHRDVTRKRGTGGWSLQKMASLRCRRDPCGVICLILTYFSVFYADYVVIQYVLIPAYSDRSVLSVFIPFKALKNQHGALFLCAVSIHLTADRSDSFLTLYCFSAGSMQNLFFWLWHILIFIVVGVCDGFVLMWHQNTLVLSYVY